jgi:hypothetical protein
MSSKKTSGVVHSIHTFNTDRLSLVTGFEPKPDWQVEKFAFQLFLKVNC